MKIAGYIRDSLDCAVDDIIDGPDQRRLIDAWARAHGHGIAFAFTDEGPTASSDLETRLGLSDALAAVRDKRVAGIVVSRLDRLTPSIILQEQLRAEIVRLSGAMFSAVDEEQRELDEPSGDRALVREVVEAMPGFRLSVRDLWVRQRTRKPGRSFSEEAALARIEHLAERGVSMRDIARSLTERPETLRGV